MHSQPILVAGVTGQTGSRTPSTPVDWQDAKTWTPGPFRRRGRPNLVSAEPLLAAWNWGGEDALEPLVIAQMRAETPGLFKAIFVDRNSAWTEQKLDLMDGEGSYFVAVGAGHLVGDESVIAMLRAQGATIERLQ